MVEMYSFIFAKYTKHYIQREGQYISRGMAGCTGLYNDNEDIKMNA